MGTLFAATLLASFTGAQELDGAGAAARTQVARQVAAEIGPSLGEVPVAILPPELAVPSPEGEAFASGWTSTLSAALQAVAEVDLIERESLDAILREQKFADSAYADPETAVAVGRIVAARALVLTRLNEWRPEGLGVLADLEVRLIDVETGQLLYAQAIRRTVWPPWISLGALIAVLLLTLVTWLWMRTVWAQRRRAELLQTVLPQARQRIRLDLDALLRSLVQARDRIHQRQGSDESFTVQVALVEIEPVLDRVRHAMPEAQSGGRRGLEAAARHMQQISRVVADLRKVSDDTDDAGALSRRLVRARGDLTHAIEAYRSALV